MPISARQAWKAGTAKRSTSSFGGAAVSPAGSGAGARDGMGSGSGSGSARSSSAFTIPSTLAGKIPNPIPFTPPLARIEMRGSGRG